MAGGARGLELLSVPYYHLVFTLPAAIADIAYQNKSVIYDILFKASAETMLTIAADPKHLGAKIGITAVLHTWGSAMTHHPHIHMIVPGGGISPDGSSWISCRPGFFLPVRVLSRLFRRLFIEKLLAAHEAGRLKFFTDHTSLAEPAAFRVFLAPMRKQEWVVYAKPPGFGGPEAVLAYLSRYTHRVAISNSRLVSCDSQGVIFKYKDYRRKGRERYKTLPLAVPEFIRRFLLHVLPSGFQPHPPLRPLRQRRSHPQHLPCPRTAWPCRHRRVRPTMPRVTMIPNRRPSQSPARSAAAV